MKILLPLLALVATIQLNAQSQNEDEKTLRHIKEELWPEAYQTQNTTLLNDILADEFQLIDASGNIFLKKDEVTYLKQNKPGYKSFKYHIERLDVYASNSAVISGTGMIQGMDQDGDYITTYRSSNVFIKMENTWRAVSSQVSGLHKTYTNKMERSGAGQ